MSITKKDRIVNAQKMILIDAYGNKQEYLYNKENNTFEVGTNVEIDGDLKINGNVKEIKCVNSNGDITTQITNSVVKTYDSYGACWVQLKGGKLKDNTDATILSSDEMFIPCKSERCLHLENDNIAFGYNANLSEKNGLHIDNSYRKEAKFSLFDNNSKTISFRMYGEPDERQGYFNFSINDEMTLLKILSYDDVKKVLTIEVCEANGVIKIDALNNSITFNGKELVNPTK